LKNARWIVKKEFEKGVKVGYNRDKTFIHKINQVSYDQENRFIESP
jgi:hypothetical protein